MLQKLEEASPEAVLFADIVIGVTTALGDDEFSLFLGEDSLQVESSDVKDLLGFLSVEDVGIGDLELDLSGSRFNSVIT